MSQDGATPPGAAAETASGSLRGLTAAGVLFAAWVLGLATLVLATANPPQLNWVQLSLARTLVVAEVENVPSGTCRLVRQFTPHELSAPLRVTNLSAAGARAGVAYLLPLVPDVAGPSGAYRIVTVPEREIGPLIYPADADLEAEVRDWQAGRRE